AVGCGLAPHLADIDPYWMAAAAIDEAVRNVVCVGGDPGQTALLDNFCWGRSDDPRQLGGLVRACQACYDVACAYGAPFISGKDSLNNEFALDASDVEPLIETLRNRATGSDVDARRLRAILPELEARLRERRRLAIPPTLLISALSLIPDVGRCVTPDLKRGGNTVLLVGGQPPVGFSFAAALAVHQAVADAIRRGFAAAVHDVSEGGWLVALAEMALAGDRGAGIAAQPAPACGPFEECCAGYLLETAEPRAVDELLRARGVRHQPIALVGNGPETGAPLLTWNQQRLSVAELRAAWSGRAG
ncbi:MAG: AIR synthase related protein, partial [Planctomycetota bacterium]